MHPTAGFYVDKIWEDVAYIFNRNPNRTNTFVTNLNETFWDIPRKEQFQMTYRSDSTKIPQIIMTNYRTKYPKTMWLLTNYFGLTIPTVLAMGQPYKFILPAKSSSQIYYIIEQNFTDSQIKNDVIYAVAKEYDNFPEIAQAQNVALLDLRNRILAMHTPGGYPRQLGSYLEYLLAEVENALAFGQIEDYLATILYEAQYTLELREEKRAEAELKRQAEELKAEDVKSRQYWDDFYKDAIKRVEENFALAEGALASNLEQQKENIIKLIATETQLEKAKIDTETEEALLKIDQEASTMAGTPGESESRYYQTQFFNPSVYPPTNGVAEEQIAIIEEKRPDESVSKEMIINSLLEDQLRQNPQLLYMQQQQQGLGWPPPWLKWLEKLLSPWKNGARK